LRHVGVSPVATRSTRSSSTPDRAPVQSDGQCGRARSIGS
jgi:hypothetical protein